MQLFYHENLSETTATITLSEEESKHTVRILRKNIGDTLHFTNGTGLWATAQIIDNNAKSCVANITAIKNTPALRPHTHIAISPTKNDARLEWFLEKATEIGINEITLLHCARTEKPYIKLSRLHSILVSGIKQSGQFYLPVLNNLQKFDDFITQKHAAQQFIAHCIDAPKLPLSQAIDVQKTDNILLLIGPEGDFTPNEVDLATKNNYQSVSLGNTRLRTETAALVGATLLRHIG